MKVDKDYSWQTKIYDSCVDALISDQVPSHPYPVGSENDANTNEFSKEEAVRMLETRMRMRTSDK